MSEDYGLVARNCSFGRGLFTTRSFSAGDQIAIVRGRVVRESNPEREEFYMDYGSEGLLEPYAPYRYLNHSCDPNCELQIEEFEDSPPEISIVALRSIKSGEQLNNDYGWPPANPVPCFCGSPKCRDWIVSPEDLPKVRRKPLPMKEFPPEFAQLLSPIGARLLRGEPAVSDCGSHNNDLILDALISKTRATHVARLLAARFREALRLKAASGDQALYAADLGSRRSRAGQLASVSGLSAMLRSDSFHQFAEQCCRQNLRKNPKMQLRCYEIDPSVSQSAVNPVDPDSANAAPQESELRLEFSSPALPGNGSVTVLAASRSSRPAMDPDRMKRGRRWQLVARFRTR